MTHDVDPETPIRLRSLNARAQTRFPPRESLEHSMGFGYSNTSPKITKIRLSK